MIIIIDYGVGNLSSVKNMLKKAGTEAMISKDRNQILDAEKIILPGVGHFDFGMQMLNKSRLRDTLDKFALELRRPILGICLGSQILGLSSKEGKEPGLGWIDMKCKLLPLSPGLRVPHMGWNNIKLKKKSLLFSNNLKDTRYYFVHSYYMDCNDSNDILATSSHGIEFTCVVQRGNIFGTQFHPEKSLRHGQEFIRKFVEIKS
ncbi:imidazole glycerol phosphate synthase subunit HisH [Alphaproteobacteria bacterium]|nr:imidazole glycerol phosphate synthase subunit HisH [Alphaproteobacteria bacterium]